MGRNGRTFLGSRNISAVGWEPGRALLRAGHGAGSQPWHSCSHFSSWAELGAGKSALLGNVRVLCPTVEPWEGLEKAELLPEVWKVREEPDT